MTGMVLFSALAMNLIGNADLSLDDGTGDPAGWHCIVPKTESTKQAINYIIFRPYYIEGEEDIADLVRTLSGGEIR